MDSHNIQLISLNFLLDWLFGISLGVVRIFAAAGGRERGALISILVLFSGMGS